MRKARTIAATLAATGLMLAGCSDGDTGGDGTEATNADGLHNGTEGNGTDADGADDGEPGACAKEVSIQALLEQMPAELIGLPHDPEFSHEYDNVWTRFYQNGQDQFSVSVGYYSDEYYEDLCPSDPKQGAHQSRLASRGEAPKQQDEAEEGEDLPWEDLEFTVGERYFACAKQPPAVFRHFYCTTSIGNAEMITYMFRPSQGDEQDLEFMKSAMAELTPLFDAQPMGPGLADEQAS